MPGSLNSGGFTSRNRKTDLLVAACQQNILTAARYFHIPTGIEHRFGEKAAQIHNILYRSMGPTTDLLRYFPDSLYLDRWRRLPTWETERQAPEILTQAATKESTGLFSFYVEYKFSDSERRAPLKSVPTKYIGIIEREAWLTYKRLSRGNPEIGTYLDGNRTKIALFYAATYAPEILYAGWEEILQPIADEKAIRKDIAQPNERSVGFSTGSGTPWINFDIRTLKPLAQFLSEDLFWDENTAHNVVVSAKKALLGWLRK
ncbi:MAG: hypothetical protein DWQ05_21145 [Calditrichaeota bacterium]|nr:MAG: hypothetical protein DWQ05_21145 [Calditrichota bacterium]